MLAGRIADGPFAKRMHAVYARKVGADIWGFPQGTAAVSRITVTDVRGIVVFDSEGTPGPRQLALERRVSHLRGQYGARSATPVMRMIPTAR